MPAQSLAWSDTEWRPQPPAPFLSQKHLRGETRSHCFPAQSVQELPLYFLRLLVASTSFVQQALCYFCWELVACHIVSSHEQQLPAVTDTCCQDDHLRCSAEPRTACVAVPQPVEMTCLFSGNLMEKLHSDFLSRYHSCIGYDCSHCCLQEC